MNMTELVRQLCKENEIELDFKTMKRSMTIKKNSSKTHLIIETIKTPKIKRRIEI
jgi:hypothetical protein